MWHLLKADFSQSQTILHLFMVPIFVTQGLLINQTHVAWTQRLSVCLLFSWPYIWGYFHSRKYNNINLLTRLPIPRYQLGLRRLLFLNTWGFLSFTLVFIFYLLPDIPRHVDWSHLLFINGITLSLYAILLIDQDMKHKSDQLFSLNKVNISKYFKIFLMSCYWLFVWGIILGTALSLNNVSDISLLSTILSFFYVTFVTPSTTLIQAFATTTIGLILSFISLYTFKHRKSYLA